MGQAVQRAPAGHPVHYERRRPEETTLYQLVKAHADTFFAQVEAETGTGLPEFVKEEFDAFLECGILAHGFVRLRLAATAPMRNGWLSPANGVGFAPRAAPGAWQKPPPTWSITSSRGCRCANGWCRFRSRCVSSSPPIMKRLTRQGHLIEEQSMTYLAEVEVDNPLTPEANGLLHLNRIALAPRAAQKVLSLQTLSHRREQPAPALCANAHGFSLHAALRCAADQRKQLERLCR
jgi:hypothetical protein